jgi:YesN/AraC family two-component response regulator
MDIEIWLGQRGFPRPVSSLDKLAGEGTNAISTVLVVDDERLIADTITAILTEHGFVAFKAYSGEEAVRLAEEVEPDIVLSDVLMPMMSGVQMAIMIKESLPETRIVLLSGQAATAELMRQAAAAGYDFELLAKPIHPEDLVKKLKEKNH